MTEKQTKRFNDFTIDKNNDREVKCKKTKNRFHHHEVKLQLYGAKIKHLTTRNL